MMYHLKDSSNKGKNSMNFFPNLQIIFNLSSPDEFSSNDRARRQSTTVAGTQTTTSSSTESSPTVSQIIQRILRPSVPLAQQVEDNDVHFYVNLDGIYPSTSGMTIEQIHDMTVLGVLEAETPSILCTVCQNPCEPGSIVQTIQHCHHVFHPVCIERWLINNNSCPVCRSTLVSSTSPGALSE